MFVVRGIKAWIIGLLTLAVIIIVLLLILKLFILLLPFILIIIVIGYFFRILNKLNKGKGRKPTTSKRIDQEYIDIKYKVKKK